MIILTLIFLAIDIFSKILIHNKFNILESHKIIRDFFKITYVRNTGAAWSIFSNNTIVVIIISFLIILGLCLYIYKNKPKNKIHMIAYAMILGGAIGNFGNRIFLGYVIDFIDIRIFGYDYPIFNVADMFIVLGVIMLLISAWRCDDGNKGSRKRWGKNR